MSHCEPLLAKGLVLFQFRHPGTKLCQRFYGQNPGLEDCLTLVLELNYSLGNLIGAPAGIPHSNFQQAGEKLFISLLSRNLQNTLAVLLLYGQISRDKYYLLYLTV